ncbi:AraC family transcriptional regulator [Oceanicella sp. SM1341]|uniref:helix-turn-helix domain-containing protein n=1 Tax=Oceanicella sp. SM1341 TaxID=1548889 RepID=UPI001E42423D|nr:AraC family transcriptional regulator [Oceanicella sp. SM1341]
MAMGFLHSMICRTEGIQRTAPVQWRSLDGICGVFWEARGEAGATGYYLSPDPRVMLFFSDVSDHIRMDGQEFTGEGRPLLRALYVPAGQPMWTRFRAEHRFSHLDLHLNRNWLLSRLAPVLGEERAREALGRAVEVQDIGSLAAVGTALRAEITAPTRHPAFAEMLALTLVTGLCDIAEGSVAEEARSGGLTPVQMRRLWEMFRENPGLRLSNSALAERVGLSPGWFAQAFKKTTGKSPLQWQQERRIAMVKERLLAGEAAIADVAMQFGFADQAHLTRVFRRHEGTTPAAWARERRAG